MKNLFIAFISIFVYSHLYSQTDTIHLNNFFDTSQTIYTLPPSQNIYGVRINGSVVLNEYYSLARVILVTKDSSEILIYEAYPWLYNNDTVIISNKGDESRYLEALDSTYIKVEIINADLYISNILIDTSDNYSSAFKSQYVDSIIQLKIDSLNNILQAHNLLWAAGSNDVAILPFNKKKILFSTDSFKNTHFNTFGFEYYIDGIFSKLGHSNPIPQSTNLVENFDWRDRHGQNWITPVKDQGPNPSCWAFGAMASLEVVINLFFNQQINEILSEQAFISCYYDIYRSNNVQGWPTPPLQQCAGINTPVDVFCKVQVLGALDSVCYPFSNMYDAWGVNHNNQPCPYAPFPNNCTICDNLCSNYLSRSWKIDSFKELVHSPYHNYQELLTESAIMEYIILNGPLPFNYLWSPLMGHTMCFVGFGIVNEEDTIFLGPSGGFIVVPSGSQFIGQYYWIVKNSYGSGWGANGYCKLINDISQITSVSIPYTPITQPMLKNYKVECVDNDGDGYYWWGIGDKPATCPAWAPDERDCDDFDPLVGPYDQYFYCTPICEFDNVWTEITDNTTINQNTHISTHIKVKDGKTLKIENGATLFIHPLTEILVENNGVLILENYGKIRTCGDDQWIGSITIEQGGILDAECLDNDGDGYYWWGTIGPKPVSCFSYAPSEIDCDDYNPFVGSYNQYNNCISICEFDNIWTEISNNLTITQNNYITTHIKVKDGNTLKIENGATLFIHPLSQIIVENGAELYLNNGYIKVCSDVPWQEDITAGTGSLLTIENESMFIDRSAPQWMPANLNVGAFISTSSGNQTDNGIFEKYCYNNTLANCDIYGGLYQWGEAMQYAGSVNCDPCGPTTGNGGVQGICPVGYHIPSDLEWSRYEWRIENFLAPYGNTPLSTFQQSLFSRGSNITDVGPGAKLKSTSDWYNNGNGTNVSGFNAIPSGEYNGSFQTLYFNALFWTATEFNSNSSFYRSLNWFYNNSFRSYNNKNTAYSVRCLRD